MTTGSAGLEPGQERPRRRRRRSRGLDRPGLLPEAAWVALDLTADETRNSS